MTCNKIQKKKAQIKNLESITHKNVIDDRRGSKTPVITSKVSKKPKRSYNWTKRENFLSSTLNPNIIKENQSLRPPNLLKYSHLEDKSRNKLMKYSTYSEQANLAKLNREFTGLEKSNFKEKDKEITSLEKSINALFNNLHMFNEIMDQDGTI